MKSITLASSPLAPSHPKLLRAKARAKISSTLIHDYEKTIFTETYFRSTLSFATVLFVMEKEQHFFTHIVVHRGAIRDTSHERRTGLWFVPSDGGSQFYFHVKGVCHNYRFEIKENWDPTCVGSALPLIYIGKTNLVSANSLVQLMRNVPIENADLEFNGQQWIWAALTFLTINNCLTKTERDEGFSRMLEVVLEGSSDELTDN